MLVRRMAGLLGAAVAMTGAMAVAAPAAHAACVGPYPSAGNDPSVGVCYGYTLSYNPDPSSTGVNGVCYVVELYVKAGGPTMVFTNKGGTGAVETGLPGPLSPGYVFCPTQII